MHISSTFDAGNIEVINADQPDDIQLKIRPDAGGEFLQWFYFRVVGARNIPCRFQLLNADQAAYPVGWDNYRAVASYDQKTWFRVPTTLKDGALIIEHTPTLDAIYYAYFAPYSLSRHAQKIAEWAACKWVKLDCLGRTLDGRDLDRLVIGHPTGPAIWIIARQHPGESMAEWWMEGFIDRLLDPDDALARTLRKTACFHLVPNMNPDGSTRGHLRTNACGANLNREWLTPTAERSPEVLLVRDAMDKTGVTVCLDVHGDEGEPYPFIAGAEGIPGYTTEQAVLLKTFKQAYVRANSDFQTVHGYPEDEPDQANMSMCTSQVAHRFKCLAMTLEMPFKDNASAPDKTYGWSPIRSVQLGASALDPFAQVLAARSSIRLLEKSDRALIERD